MLAVDMPLDVEADAVKPSASRPSVQPPKPQKRSMANGFTQPVLAAWASSAWVACSAVDFVLSRTSNTRMA